MFHNEVFLEKNIIFACGTAACVYVNVKNQIFHNIHKQSESTVDTVITLRALMKSFIWFD